MTIERATTLVTGGAGFIGSALCARLAAAGERVVAYDDLSRGRRAYLTEAATLVEGDIRDARRWRQTVETVRPHTVVHLAAMHFIPDCIARPADTIDVNVEGTRTVLEGCRDGSVTQVIFASTAAVYAPSDDACREGRTRLGPLEVYGESKLKGEALVETFHRDTGIAAVNVRLFNAVGPRETNPHVVPHIFESLQTGDAVALGNIEPRRDYIDTRDVADAITGLLAVRSGLHCVNVGTGTAYSVRELVGILSGILGRTITIVEEASRMRASERLMLVADRGAIGRLTGWTPRLRIEDTLRDLAHAYGVRVGTALGGRADR